MKTSIESSGGASRRRDERGNALLMSMIVLGTMMVLCSAFLRLGTTFSRQHHTSLDQTRAFYVAEAGLTEAAAALYLGYAGNVGTQAVPARSGDGLVWVTATHLGNADYQLDANGLCGGGRASIRSVIHVTQGPNLNNALTSDLPLNVPSNFLIDSFDPTLGTYSGQTKHTVPGHNDMIVGTNGSIASNQGVNLSSGVRVYGNAIPGPGQAVTGIGGNTFVTGTTTAAAHPASLAPVVVPVIPSQGSKFVNKTDTPALRTLSSGNYHFSSLEVGSQAVFTIQGPSVVVVDSFMTNSGCMLNIDATNGPVKIYFTGSATFVSNMTVTSTTPTAKDVTTYFTSATPVNLASNANYQGTIYAPLATVTVSSNWVNYGALTARQIVLSSNVVFHYDESLAQTWDQQRPTLEMMSWRKIAVPRAIANRRVDPNKVLGVENVALPRASDAYH